MSLSGILNMPQVYRPVEHLKLDHLRAAAKRVFDRWPEVVPVILEKEQEALVQDVDQMVKTGNWRGTSVSKVVRAARVVFSEGFRSREEYKGLREFYLKEIEENSSSGFLNSMFSVYLSSYDPAADHTVAQARAFKKASGRLGDRWRILLNNAPEILDPRNGHETLGKRMAAMETIWNALREMGFNAPHAPGIIDHAHLHYLKLVGSKLSEWANLDKLLHWLQPSGGNARLAGASQSIETMIRPWLNGRDCPDVIRTPLLERLVAMYGDPRVSRASHWNQVGKACLEILHRWLTKADLGFFIEVVNKTQPSHMWVPRRDFWMKLHKDGRIDAAWVAFCPSAATYAKQHLISSREVDPNKRFGRQTVGGNRINTSLLIMKIGTKIVVDGCHNYMTHIFNEQDANAPKLFRPKYDCEEIRMESPRARSHNPVENWKNWVMMNI